MSTAGTGIDNPNLVPYRRYLEQAVQQVNVTLNSLKLNHPSITQEDMDKIKRYISESLQAQDFYDEQKCKEKNKPSSFIVSTTPSTYKINTVKTSGINRKMMKFVTSESPIGFYKLCVSDIEGMESAVKKLDAMPYPSKLNHKKLKLLESYSKHYKRFQEEDLDMLLKFDNVEEKLKEEFERSHDTVGRSAWKQNLKDWKDRNSPRYPKTPATYKEHYHINLD